MNIALVSDDGLDRTDGVQQQMKLIGSWLAARGHTVTYLVGQTDMKNYKALEVHSLANNIKIRANQNTFSLPVWIKRREVEALLDAKRFDLIHVMLPYSPLLGRYITKAARRRGIPLFGTFHTYPASRWQQAGSRAYGLLVKSVWPGFSSLMSVSEATRDYVKHTFGVDSLVLPNAIDSKQFRVNRPKIAGKIVFLGRLERRKGPQHLLQAMTKLGDIDVNLSVYGRGPLQSELAAFIEQNQLGGRVKLEGFVEESDKAKVLAEAELAVYPATGGEAFGIVLLEAMAAGTVPLAGNNPGYATVMSWAPELLVPADQPDRLARRIRELMTDQPRLGSYAARLPHAIAPYDIDTVGKKLLKIYDEALAGRPKS